MMLGFDPGVAFECAVQAAVSAAIGVQHQDDPSGGVQSNGFSDLFNDEFAFRLVVGRCQTFGAAGDLDGIRVDDTDALEKLTKGEVETVIEAPHNRGVALIPRAGGVEVKDFFHARQGYCAGCPYGFTPSVYNYACSIGVTGSIKGQQNVPSR